MNFHTGAAGFIGSNLVMKLLSQECPIHIVGIDNLNDYYDVSIKEYRLKQIESLVEPIKPAAPVTKIVLFFNSIYFLIPHSPIKSYYKFFCHTSYYQKHN